MITPDEEFRRLLLFMHALWEAREELNKRNRAIDRDALDWFQRERFDEALEADCRVLQKRQDLLLQAAYDGETAIVRCTQEEHRTAVSMALGILEGTLQAEHAVGQLCSDDFPQRRRSTPELNRATRAKRKKGRRD